MPHSGIYQIVNTITGDCYVGSAVDFQVRKVRHFRELRQGIHHSLHLQRAYNLYGEDAFIFIILEEVERDKERLFQQEGHWIQQLQPQYNTGKLSATTLGAKRTPEVRQRMAEKATGRKLSEEAKQKISEKHRGRKQSQELIEKRFARRKAPVYTDEQRQQFAERSREMWASRSPEERHEITQKRPPVSAETRQKQKEAKLGKKQDPEVTAKRVAKARGSKRSEETRERMRAAQQAKAAQHYAEHPKEEKEYAYSEERRRKMSEGKKASWERKKAQQAETLHIEQPRLFD